MLVLFILPQKFSFYRISSVFVDFQLFSKKGYNVSNFYDTNKNFQKSNLPKIDAAVGIGDS